VIYKNKIKVMKAEILNDVFNGEEPNYKPQFNNEIDLKVAMFKDAIERGEFDHLNPDQSFKLRAKQPRKRKRNVSSVTPGSGPCRTNVNSNGEY
jgi:hypothetical protein